MDNAEKLLKELEKLNRKIDRIGSMVQAMPTTHHTDLGDWLTEEQAKELLQLGTTSLWELRKRKKITFSKVGNRVYYDRKSIVNFIEHNCKNR